MFVPSFSTSGNRNSNLHCQLQPSFINLKLRKKKKSPRVSLHPVDKLRATHSFSCFREDPRPPLNKDSPKQGAAGCRAPDNSSWQPGELADKGQELGRQRISIILHQEGGAFFFTVNNATRGKRNVNWQNLLSIQQQVNKAPVILLKCQKSQVRQQQLT